MSVRTRERPLLMQLTTADISLELLLGPQLSAFVDAGYEVVGVSASGEFVSRVVERGVEHVALGNATRSMDLRADVAALAELTALFRRRRPDIVHTHNPKTGVYGRVAARLAGVPAIVNTVHGLYATPDDALRRRAAVYAAERIASACSHVELVQSAEDLATLRSLRVPPGKLRLLGNGVDLDRFRPQPELRAEVRAELGIDADAVVVGAVGRLVREKGYPELLQAWKQVRATSPTAELVIAGPFEPDKADSLSRDDVNRATAAGVRFLGMRHDVNRLYQAFDIYTLLSHREGFPRSAMEAAATAIPVVATDIRGCREVVRDGVTGVLVPCRDVAGAADAIGRLVADGGRRAQMSARSLELASTEFDQRRVIDITLGAYRDLLAGTPDSTKAGPR
mgnify:CR=1 FL=1